MKSVESLGRRSFLGLAAAAAAASPVAALGGPPSAPLPQDAVRIYPRRPVADLTQLDARLARAVRDLLTPELHAAAGGSFRHCVRNRLVSTFRGSIRASAVPPRWLWMWVDGEWKWVCLDSASFEIQMNDRFATIVEVDDVQSMG